MSAPKKVSLKRLNEYNALAVDALTARAQIVELHKALAAAGDCHNRLVSDFKIAPEDTFDTLTGVITRAGG